MFDNGRAPDSRAEPTLEWGLMFSERVRALLPGILDAFDTLDALDAREALDANARRALPSRSRLY
jgi:hypothetical protein